MCCGRITNGSLKCDDEKKPFLTALHVPLNRCERVRIEETK